MADSLQAVARLVAGALERAGRELGRSEASVAAFVARLGFTLPSVPPALISLGATARVIADARTALETSASRQDAGADGVDAQVVAQYVELASKLLDLLSQIRSLPGSLQAQLPAGFLAATDLANQLPRRLLDAGLYDLMVGRTKRMEAILRLAGLVEVVNEPADPAKFQPAYQRRTIRWDRLGDFLGDPASLLRTTYGWGTAAFDARTLLDRVMHLSFALAGPAELDWPTPARLQALTGTLPGFDVGGPPMLVVPLVDQDPLHAEISVLALPASGGALPGLGFGLSINAAVPASVALSDLLTLELDAPEALGAGLSVVVRPGQPPQAKLGLEGPTSAALDAKRTGAGIRIGGGDPTSPTSPASPTPASPISLLSLPLGLELAAGAIRIGGGVASSPSGPEPYVEAAVTGGKLTLDLGGRDSFLASIIPGGPLELDFDLALTWTPQGLALSGSGALSLFIPLHQQLGPIAIDALNVVAAVDGHALRLETSVTGGAALGPLTATVDRVGLATTLSFSDGNLGPLDVSFGFKPPTGVGLSIDAGVIAGGGFLSIDVERGEYSGALELVFGDFLALHAIGLITTKTPDGSAGFSLLVIITADFGAGIQLGFGFTLLAVGGLLGLNRTAQHDRLIDAVRTGAIKSVLFPQDVVANATRIVSDLRALFPPSPGTFLVGPMAEIGWGEPTLMTLSLGVIVELPPGDVALLGLLTVALPTADLPLLLLQVSFAGVLELDKQRLYFFAALFDSHLLFITIEGEMGALLAFGGDADFVVTVGGFHPQFTPPPLPFPSPKRIAIDLINETYARIRCEAYFAVTTNTAQFGSHAEYFFGFDALSVSGHSSFDALIQFSPLHFTVEVSTSMSVKVFGLGVYGIDVDLTLDGPARWHAHGSASLSFFFFSVDVGIDFTWGDDRDTLLPPIAVLPILLGELGKQSNWRAVLPAGSNLLVSLRKLDETEAARVLHPVGTLQVSQRAVPLDLTIDRIGGQRPSDGSRFTLEVTAGGLGKSATLRERFAPAQFQDMDDAAKLSQAAFVPLDSGVELAAPGNAYASGTAITRNVRYDLTVIDTKLRRAVRRFFVLPLSLFNHFLGAGSVKRSALADARRKQTRPFADTIAVRGETFAVALQQDNSAHAPSAIGFASRVAAQDYLSRQVARDPSLADTLHVLPEYELAA